MAKDAENATAFANFHAGQKVNNAEGAEKLASSKNPPTPQQSLEVENLIAQLTIGD